MNERKELNKRTEQEQTKNEWTNQNKSFEQMSKWVNEWKNKRANKINNKWINKMNKWKLKIKEATNERKAAV